jgi:hypothetical protein
MIFAMCSLITNAKKSARKTRWLIQYQEICKQPSNSFRRYIYKETDLKIHPERSNIIRLCSKFSMENETVLPKQTQVVICWAGTVANSIAYHLVQNGWNDILVLEQKKWDYFAVFDDTTLTFFIVAWGYTSHFLADVFTDIFFVSLLSNWTMVYTTLVCICRYFWTAIWGTVVVTHYLLQKAILSVVVSVKIIT